MIADLTRLLSPRERAVREVRAALDWLRGIRDTRMVATSGDLREERARLVREIWVATVLALIPDPKPSWTALFDETDDFQREVDARIGEGIAAAERDVHRRRRHHPGRPGARDRPAGRDHRQPGQLLPGAGRRHVQVRPGPPRGDMSDREDPGRILALLSQCQGLR